MLPWQCAHPGAQEEAGTMQAPAAHWTAPLTCGRAVQSWPHAPQLWESSGTQAPPQTNPAQPPASLASGPAERELSAPGKLVLASTVASTEPCPSAGPA